MERPLLLGEDPDRDVEVAHQDVEVVAEQRAPGRPDEPQLAGEGRRRASCRQPDELDQRQAVAIERRPCRERRLEAGDGFAVAGAPREVTVIHELEQGIRCRVLVGDPGEQELLEAGRRWLRLGADPRELRAEPVEQPACLTRADRVLEVDKRGRDGAGHPKGFVAVDQQVADLVDEAQRRDVAGLDGRSGRSQGVHRGREPADPGEVGGDQVALRADERAADPVSDACLAAEVERSHR
jgi:hypothetical protein